VPAKWINKRRRARIYERDGWRCAYCDQSERPGEAGLLSLDHLRPLSRGGSNRTDNLVTACKSCNSARQNRSLRSFCIAVAAYTQQDWRVILARVKSARRRALPPPPPGPLPRRKRPAVPVG
jgi:CRISPR/Cas system Type II protein with McrA/HNH and RuvC-like nuclease domain